MHWQNILIVRMSSLTEIIYYCVCMCIYMFQMYKKKVLIKTFNKTETFSIVLAYSRVFALSKLRSQSNFQYSMG